MLKRLLWLVFLEGTLAICHGSFANTGLQKLKYGIELPCAFSQRKRVVKKTNFGALLLHTWEETLLAILALAREIMWPRWHMVVHCCCRHEKMNQMVCAENGF